MNSILIPKNLESRLEKHKRIDYQRIQEYIKNGSKGDLDLDNTPLTKLPDNLIRVGGSLYLRDSSIEDLNNLKYIENSLYADFSKLKSLPSQITRIGDLYLVGCPIDNIDNIKYVGGNLSIVGTNINELPEGLMVMGESLYCCNTPLSKRFSDRSSFKEYLEERNITVKVNIFMYIR